MANTYLKRSVRSLFLPIAIGILPGIFLSTCKVVDPAEDVPSYITIDHIDLSVISGQGSNAHKITDAWVFIDNELIGGFELPARIPILAEGSHQLQVRAGVMMNGASTTRVIYPFYKGYEATITLTRGQSLTVQPTVTYFPATNFTWQEDFEPPGGSSLTDDGTTGAPWPNLLHESTTDAFEGTSTHVYLRHDTLEFRGRTTVPYTLPSDGSQVYLELNYKCNKAFAVGVITSGASTTEFVQWGVVNASDTWNKIYINLTDNLSSFPAPQYYIYFDMLRAASDPDAELHLDNIKLLKQ